MVDNTVSNKQMTVIYNKELLKNEKKIAFLCTVMTVSYIWHKL